ncbi:MAG: MoaD/ThiS family protein [Anaerolineae bacterium]
MRITVKLGAPLSQVVGEGKIILSMSDEATVADALDELRARYPDFEAGLKGKGLRKPFDRIIYQLFVGTRAVPFEEAASTPLHDGDRIYLFLPVAGG